jgi:hypothetical protein
MLQLVEFMETMGKNSPTAMQTIMFTQYGGNKSAKPVFNPPRESQTQSRMFYCAESTFMCAFQVGAIAMLQPSADKAVVGVGLTDTLNRLISLGKLFLRQGLLSHLGPDIKDFK